MIALVNPEMFDLLTKLVAHLRPDIAPDSLYVQAYSGVVGEEIELRICHNGRLWVFGVAIHPSMYEKRAILAGVLDAARYCLELAVPSPPAGKWRKFDRLSRSTRLAA